WTWFQVGSVTTGTPPASITLVTVEFSDDGGATWGYSPLSGNGGAPVGYDALVTNVRYIFTGDIAAGVGSTVGLGLTVQIMN
ncbi:MAG: hypothetical protein KAJ17_04465, partial [Candidatus Krumholzibacteria bacterium]|nr:hypothetical protein [Candidatus Krumholzibacteria bacterium]